MSFDHRTLAKELEEALAELPMFDVHTHLVGGHLGARGLHDVLLYHMVVSDLYAAGCPSGARLTQYPGWPTREEAHQRLTEAIPYLPLIRNTSCFWGVRLILRDLYDWHEPITLENWQRADAMIRQRADDRTWWYSVLDRLHIQRTCTESARREGGVDDARLQYSTEWCFFTRCQWGEFDTALYELERAWGRLPEAATPIGGGQRAPTDRTIQTLDDVHAAVAHYVDNLPYDLILSTAAGVSTDIDYRLVSDAEMAAALSRRAQAGPTERDIYARSSPSGSICCRSTNRSASSPMPIALNGRTAKHCWHASKWPASWPTRSNWGNTHATMPWPSPRPSYSKRRGRRWAWFPMKTPDDGRKSLGVSAAADETAYPAPAARQGYPFCVPDLFVTLRGEP
jgi:hypothetical protein